MIVKTIQIDRDSRGNWTEAQLPDGQVLRYGYNNQGQLVQFQNGAIISRHACDAAGHLAAVVEGDQTGIAAANYGFVAQPRFGVSGSNLNNPTVTKSAYVPEPGTIKPPVVAPGSVWLFDGSRSLTLSWGGSSIRGPIMCWPNRSSSVLWLQ